MLTISRGPPVFFPVFHFQKHCHFIEDTEGLECELRFVRDQQGREIDFIIIQDGRPSIAVECKLSERSISPALKYFKGKFPEVEAVQVLLTPGIDTRDKDLVRICNAEKFLQELAI